MFPAESFTYKPGSFAPKHTAGSPAPTDIPLGLSEELPERFNKRVTGVEVISVCASVYIKRQRRRRNYNTITVLTSV